MVENNYIEVRKSGLHGTGVFAKVDIPAGAKIIEYVGERITKQQSDKVAEERIEKYRGNEKESAGVYLFELNNGYDLNGDVEWNPARFINHSCNPNADTLNDRHHIWIYAKKDIKKGEEITYDYGYDIDDYQSHPCYCGSENCVGFIVAEDKRDRIRKVVKSQ